MQCADTKTTQLCNGVAEDVCVSRDRPCRVPFKEESRSLAAAAPSQVIDLKLRFAFGEQ